MTASLPLPPTADDFDRPTPLGVNLRKSGQSILNCCCTAPVPEPTSPPMWFWTKVPWSLAGWWRSVCFAEDCSALWLVFWVAYESTSTVYTCVKPTIFSWILTIKLWVSAYMWVVPHSHTLTARVSTAWTISRPVGSNTEYCCCSCIPVKSAIVNLTPVKLLCVCLL